MTFVFVHSGFYVATSAITDDEYVVRTRPLNDGWMAINETEGLVLGTGLSFAGAKQRCIQDASLPANVVIESDPYVCS